VFADESGFLLAPLVVKTWAPRGSTPLQHHRQGRREKISVISGISLSPRRHHLGLYYLLFYDHIAQEEVCVFLRELLRHLRGLSSFSWTTPPPIRESHSRNFSLNTGVSKSSISPPTLQNLIRTKEFGRWQSGNSPIAAPRMWMH
jgi:hypothetical protein